MKGKSLCRVRLFATPWTAAHQAPPSMGFSRQEHWSGVPLMSACGGRVSVYKLSSRVPASTNNLLLYYQCHQEASRGRESEPLTLLPFGQKALILWCSAFFIVQLSHPYMTTGKAIALTRWTFVGKVMSLLFNMLSMLEKTMAPHSSALAWRIPWMEEPGGLQSMG